MNSKEPNIEKENKKNSHYYLFYGENEVEINKERIQLIQSLLSPEERLENLTEYEAPQGRTLSLSSIGRDLMAELSTLSLFPDSRRVVVVYNLDGFFSSKKSSSDMDEYFANFLKKELPSTNNIVIFIALENFEKNRIVNKKSILYETVSKEGIVKEFKEPPIIWQIEPAILQRNAALTITLFRNWLQKDSGAARKLFNLLVKIVNLLIQINILNESREELDFREDKKVNFFPSKMTPNIKTLNPYVLKRYESSARLFSLEKIKWANRQLLEINRVVFPQSSDLYVPDLNTVIEIFILKFLSTEEGVY